MRDASSDGSKARRISRRGWALWWRCSQCRKGVWWRYARQAAPFLHMPMLLMLAGRDRIVDNRRTRAFFARTAASRRTLVEYPGAAHTLEFEPDPLPYFADLTNWIGAVTKS